MSNEKEQLDIEKIRAEITHIMSQTIETNKKTRWYEVTIGIGLTLAIVAITKLFL